MGVARELGVAAALATGRDRRVAELPAAERVASFAWLPAVGALVGAAAAGAAAALGVTGSAPLAAVAAVAVLRAGDRHASLPRALAVAIVEWGALASLAPSARIVALVVAPMLARWACVVQCYGGVPASGTTGLAALAGRVRFREFAVASVTALGTMLVLLDAVGLAVAVACAVMTIGIRLVAYRRAGGLDDATLATTGTFVEATALVLLAAIGSALGSGR